MQRARPTTIPSESASRTITATGTPTNETADDIERGFIGALQLRGSHKMSSNGKKVIWGEEVIDNEGLGRKSSKICCIYHKPRAFDESSSSSSCSSSSSDNDAAGPSRPPIDPEELARRLRDGDNATDPADESLAIVRKSRNVRAGKGQAENGEAGESESSEESDEGRRGGEARPSKKNEKQLKTAAPHTHKHSHKHQYVHEPKAKAKGNKYEVQ